MTITVGAVLACRNRRELTISCLRSLFEQRVAGIKICAYVVDDASSDGTPEAIKSEFASVNLMSGSGQLYWNGGMRVAFAAARKASHDYYLWLNDDTQLFGDSLNRLIAAHAELSSRGNEPTILVGSTCAPSDQTETTYGGWVRKGQGNWLDLRLVSPSKSGMLPCDTFNGNCVLIPREAAGIVGNLDGSFTHSMGDIDYGLRARKLGCQLRVVAGHVGTCELNRGNGLWSDASLPMMSRWRKLLGPKGLPPREWLTLTRRHTGRFWLLYWLNPYVKFWFLVFPSYVYRRK